MIFLDAVQCSVELRMREDGGDPGREASFAAGGSTRLEDSLLFKC